MGGDRLVVHLSPSRHSLTRTHWERRTSGRPRCVRVRRLYSCDRLMWRSRAGWSFDCRLLCLLRGGCSASVCLTSDGGLVDCCRRLALPLPVRIVALKPFVVVAVGPKIADLLSVAQSLVHLTDTKDATGWAFGGLGWCGRPQCACALAHGFHCLLFHVCLWFVLTSDFILAVIIFRKRRHFILF